MESNCDYLVVGAGLSGASVARALSDAGHRVVVVERRPEVSGNIHDYVHESGIRVHSYGPHLFRTSSAKVQEFVQRFATFYSYEHRIVLQTPSETLPWPPNESFLSARFGERWKEALIPGMGNFEAVALSRFPKDYYEKAIRGYTERQWGTSASMLSAGLAARLRVAERDDWRLSSKEFQGLPQEGYLELVRSMLAGIEVHLGRDYLHQRSLFCPKFGTVYTGPLDELFECRFGRLRYRRQLRETTYYAESELIQPAAQINYPSAAAGAPLRSIEWMHLVPPLQRSACRGTVITRETPCEAESFESCEYPYPDEENRKLADRYRKLAAAIPKFVLCGRLAEYRYLDMDEAIARALTVAERLIRNHGRDSALRAEAA